jgi:hypothetical protein
MILQTIAEPPTAADGGTAVRCSLVAQVEFGGWFCPRR